MRKRCKECGSDLDKNYCPECGVKKTEAIVSIDEMEYLSVHKKRDEESLTLIHSILEYGKKTIGIGFVLSIVISGILLYLLLTNNIQLLTEYAVWLFGAVVTAGLYQLVIFYRLNRANKKASGEIEKLS